MASKGMYDLIHLNSLSAVDCELNRCVRGSEFKLQVLAS